MYANILLLTIILLIAIYYQSIQENFGIFGKDKKVYGLQPTAQYPLNYTGCVALSNKEHDSRFINCPFYCKIIQTNNLKNTLVTDNTSYINRPYSLAEINRLLEDEIKDLPKTDLGAVTVLIATLIPFGRQRIIFLFPTLDKTKKPVTSYALLSKFNRWYYTLLHTTYYTASNICIEASYNQCPGIPISRRRTGNFLIGFTEYINITPCGTLFGADINPVIPFYARNIFYATYIPKKYYKKPNVSILSQYDGMRYGCETQLISENGQYILMLDNIFRGLILYKVISGNPYKMCNLGGASVPRRQVWRFPLKSARYARFKLEDTRIKLIDYNREVWRAEIDTPNIPIVLKLTDKGELAVYDSTNKFIKFIDMKAVISGETVEKEDIELEEEIELELQNKRNMQKQQQAMEAQQKLADEEYYNKQVCPIGSVN
jgi:hypothetical protein